VDNQGQGALGESLAITAFVRAGFQVSIPILRAAPYDLIVEWGGALWRVQVKHVGVARQYVNIGRTGEGYGARDIDLLAIVQGKRLYLMPWPVGLARKMRLDLRRQETYDFRTVVQILRGGAGNGPSGAFEPGAGE